MRSRSMYGERAAITTGSVGRWVRLVTVALLGSLSLALTAGSAQAQPRADLANVVVDAVNAERVRHGLPRLRVADELGQVAVAHSETMAARDHLHHNPSLSEQVAGWRRLSENVGRGHTVMSLHAAFMQSEGHRNNVLDPNVSEIGAGVVVVDGTTWVTKVFRRPTGTPTSAGFGDVSAANVHADAIGALAASNVTVGCRPGLFCPAGLVTRGQAATLVARAAGVLPDAANSYIDVHDGMAHAGNISGMTASGVTSGCDDVRFCPNDPITRSDLAAFIARALSLAPRDGDTFLDTASDRNGGWIEALADAGVTYGCGDDRFCPNNPVTRQQVASLLVRAFGL